MKCLWYEVVKDAIKQNKLKECLEGKDKYKYEDKNNPGPIDYWIVLSSIYELYNNEPDLKVDIIFENTLIAILEENIEGLYLGIRYIYDQIENENKKISPFIIDKNKALSKVSYLINKNIQELNSLDSLPRLNVKGNIYKKIFRINEALKREYGVAIL